MQKSLTFGRSLDHIYWIGGAPCAGKTSIARLLSERFNLRYIRVDDYVGELERHAKPQRQPFSYLMNKHGEPKRCETLLNLTALEELLRLEESFEYVIEEIFAMPKRQTIVEGCALLPELLDDYLADANKAIWLAPTVSFQEKMYPHRGGRAQDILDMTSDPLLALKHWMMRERALAEHIINSAKERAFQYHVVDGSLSIACSADLIARRFGLVQSEKTNTIPSSFMKNAGMYTPAVSG